MLTRLDFFTKNNKKIFLKALVLYEKTSEPIWFKSSSTFLLGVSINWNWFYIPDNLLHFILSTNFIGKFVIGKLISSKVPVAWMAKAIIKLNLQFVRETREMHFSCSSPKHISSLLVFISRKTLHFVYKNVSKKAARLFFWGLVQFLFDLTSAMCLLSSYKTYHTPRKTKKTYAHNEFGCVWEQGTVFYSHHQPIRTSWSPSKTITLLGFYYKSGETM